MEFEEIKDDYKSESGQIISKKRAALLGIGAPQLREVFATLKAEEGTYSEAKERLTEYYTPKKNLTAERWKNELIECMHYFSMLFVAHE